MDAQQLKTLENMGGFAFINSAFEKNDLDQLENSLDELFPDDFDSPTSDATPIKGRKVLEVTRALNRSTFLRTCAVFKTCQSIASQYLNCSAHYTFDHAIYKYPGAGSGIGWHQDQAYQRKDLCMRSIHFWIPLQDSSELNGGLEFSPGSHKYSLLTHLKTANAKTLEVITDDDLEVFSCHIPRGGLSIHLPYTLHRSTENNTSNVRKAWILHFSQYGKWDILRPKNIMTHIAKLREKHVFTHQ